MRVLVTGGTGFVGSQVVRHLQRCGHEVRVLSRGIRRNPALSEAVQGSVLEPSTLPAALDGMDGVVHLVGIISEIGGQTFERVHTEGTANLLQAIRGTGIRRFIHMSALGTRPNAVARYHQSKWAAEQVVRQSGLEWTIFRPSLIYGSADGFVTLFARMARFSPVLPIIGSGNALVQPIAVGDVARCFGQAPGLKGTVEQTYDLCGPQAYSFNEVMQRILLAQGRRRFLVHLPLPLARLQAALFEFLFPRILGKAPPLNRDQIQMLQEDNVGDPAPFVRDFGFQPRSFPDGLKEVFQGL